MDRKPLWGTLLKGGYSMRHFLRDVAVQVIGGVIVAVVIRFMLNQ